MTTALMRLTPREQALQECALAIRNRNRGHLRELWLEWNEGVLVIRGEASSYYGKALALDEVRHRCHPPAVANLVEVIDRDPAAPAPLTVPG